MRTLLFTIFLFPLISAGKDVSCKDVRQGTFKVHALFGGLNTIIRTNDKQIETYGRTGLVLEYDIQWTSDCSFMLLNQKILKGRDSTLLTNHSDTIINEIVEVNNYWNKINTSINGCDPATEICYFNLDTTHLYKDLTEFNEFKDFQGPRSGGTFVGYNYAVVYKQNTEDTSKYVITFWEALQINDRPKFRLLDNLQFTVDTNQRIAASGCRFDDEYDKEIVAIYTAKKTDKEAQILRAWRCNKTRMKIEEVPVEHVKFRVADKTLPVWGQ